jgi:sensor histidine kinase YesM
MAKLLELYNVLIWYGFGVAVLHLIVLFESRPDRRKLLWGLPFLLTLGLDLLFLAFSGTLHNAPFFLLWVIFNLLIHGFGFVRDAIRREKLLHERELELKNARITAMMQQIRPHFIYNTLSSIYVLCRDDPPLAMKVIEDFTAYLQANFTGIAAAEPISFPDELAHTRAYLAVEALRYGEKLHVEFDTQYTAFRLPALTLQPLVENAVRHSVGKGLGPVRILVRSRYEDGCAVIMVEDDGPGFDPGEQKSPEQIGLKNVEERLKMMSGGTLEVRSSPGHGTAVTVRLPSR